MGVGMGPDVTSDVNKYGGRRQSHVTRLMTFTGSDVSKMARNLNIHKHNGAKFEF
jgi:ActR/RegA family two-component response regulator